MVIMSILNMGLPAEVNGKHVPEWMQAAYGIFIAGWGNFTVITAVSVLSFSAYPWARRFSMSESSIMFLALLFFLGVVTILSLGKVLAVSLKMGLEVEPASVAITVLVGTLVFMLATIAEAVLVRTGIACKNVLRALTHGVRQAFAKDN